MKGSNGFLVVLPKQIIEILQNSNLSWLRMFYALPKNIQCVLNSEQYCQLLQGDSFLELVWDCYAWAVWQSFRIPHKGGTYHDIPGDWQIPVRSLSPAFWRRLRWRILKAA